MSRMFPGSVHYTSDKQSRQPLCRKYPQVTWSYTADPTMVTCELCRRRLQSHAEQK